jgi:hypothetical protein
LVPIWQNLTNPLDVNHDEFVSPLDALLVINHLNASGSRLLTAGELDLPFVDVNGDGYLSPIDALQIINDLNSSAARPVTPQHAEAVGAIGEGELSSQSYAITERSEVGGADHAFRRGRLRLNGSRFRQPLRITTGGTDEPGRPAFRARSVQRKAGGDRIELADRELAVGGLPQGGEPSVLGKRMAPNRVRAVDAVIFEISEFSPRSILDFEWIA